jgi:FtsH-binding integral membrane protein
VPEADDLASGRPEQAAALPDAATRRWRQRARWLVGLEALAPLAFAGYGVVQLITGGAVVQRNETMLVVLLAVAGLALLFVAHALGQGRRSVRTATLVWQLLLALALGPAMWQAGLQALAAAVIVLAVVTGYAAVRATAEPAPPGAP